MAPRRTGATSISRRKPNSRSHTIDPAEKIAVNIVDIATTPGNRNVRRLSPPVPPETRVDRPVPSTNRNSTGWSREEMMRGLSWTNRISSRYHTIFIARRSCHRPASGNRVGATSAVVA